MLALFWLPDSRRTRAFHELTRLRIMAWNGAPFGDCTDNYLGRLLLLLRQKVRS